jgi:hypothetical protein
MIFVDKNYSIFVDKNNSIFVPNFSMLSFYAKSTSGELITIL